MEKVEKYNKILNEMRELLKEKEILKEIENQKKLLKVKEMLEENKIKKIFNVDNISYFKKYEFDIPDFIKNVEYKYVITIIGKKKYLRKCKEFALLNDVPIILVVNFLLLYLWRKIRKI